jgi:hypothetical protein
MKAAGSHFLNIAGAATTTVRTGPGILERIVVNRAVANGVITIYDNTAGSGTLIATITHAASLLESSYYLEYGLRFSTGLTIVTSSTDNVTAVFTPTL